MIKEFFENDDYINIRAYLSLHTPIGNSNIKILPPLSKILNLSIKETAQWVLEHDRKSFPIESVEMANELYSVLKGSISFESETIEEANIRKEELLERKEYAKKHTEAKLWYDTLSVEAKAHVDILIESAQNSMIAIG